MAKHFCLLSALIFGVTLVTAASRADAVLIGGVEFPQGGISFADSVTSYSPNIVTLGQSGNQSPSAPHRDPSNALGIPDYDGVNNCAGQPSCSFVSLGNGGSIVLEFIDNFLTGSGNNGLDLWVFEIGPAVESMSVEISKDGLTFFSVGTVSGATAGVDIDAFGFGTSDLFRFVRLTDNPSDNPGNGVTAGADIDAVGAISSVAAAVPEPVNLLLVAMGIAILWLRRRLVAGPSAN